jgi:NurA-like 5'-3' nuclease
MFRILLFEVVTYVRLTEQGRVLNLDIIVSPVT